LPAKAKETLAAIRAIGYHEVEATYDGLDELWPVLQASGLKPVSIHLNSKAVTQGYPGALSPMLDRLKQRGFQYAVFPYLPEPERGGVETMKALAEKLNKVGEKCRSAGLSFCYHNHAFEFASEDGTTLFQTLLDNTDRKLVGLELDVFWVSVAGRDPAGFIKQLSGRVLLLHLKDKAGDTPVMWNESVEPTAFKELGSGVLDWPGVLRAAAAARVAHYFVEQDQTPGDPLDSLRKSYEFISKVKY
jgi:sugar phosphate isomerase/epimerase